MASDEGESWALSIFAAIVAAIGLPIAILGLLDKEERSNAIFVATSLLLAISILTMFLGYLSLRRTSRLLRSSVDKLEVASEELKETRSELQKQSDAAASATKALGMCQATGCLINLMTINQKLWPDGLREQAIAFARLTAGSRLDVTADEFDRRADALRRDESRSIHVLYATTDAVGVYYGQINEDWVESEPSDGRSSRQRILIIEYDGLGYRDYRAKVLHIFNHLDRSSKLRVVFDRDLLNHPGVNHCLRDFGVFWDKNNQPTGTFRFSQMATIRSLSHASAGYYIVTDAPYLASTARLFDQVWGDKQLQVAFDLGRNQIAEWRVKHLPTHPESPAEQS